MKNTLCIIICWLSIASIAFSNNTANSSPTILPQYAVQNYTVSNGLGNSLVNDILQDHQGILWFATWNGLSKFDGYTFRNFKARANNNVEITNNRILSIKEDSIGFLWILCYDNSVYRFDPQDETFTPIAIKASPHSNAFKAIKVLENGIVWIISKDIAVRGQSQKESRKLKLTNFHSRNFGEVIDILQDKSQQEWILSQKGLFIYNPKENKTVSVCQTIPDLCNTLFYTAKEEESQIILGAGKGRVFTYNKQSKHFTFTQFPTQANITLIQDLPNGKKLYATDKDGFFIACPSKIEHFSQASHPELIDNHIRNVYIDRQGLLWIEHEVVGISMFNPDTKQFTYFLMRDEHGHPLMTDTGQIIFEDSNDRLWIHPKGGGLSYYDRKENQLIPFNPTQKTHAWKSNDRCFYVMKDRQDNLWISTQLGGLKKITFQHKFFHLFPIDTQNAESSQNDIRAIKVDKQGYTWVGTRNMDVTILDNTRKLIGRLSLLGDIVTNDTPDTHIGKVYNIFQDQTGDYWIATKGQGIYRLHPTATNKFSIRHYVHNPQDPYSLNCNDVYSIFQDSQKRMWIATYGGGLNLIENPSSEPIRFIHYQNELKSYPINKYYKLRHIIEDREGRIWISTTAGIIMFNATFPNLSDIRYTEQYHITGDSVSLSNNDVHMVQYTKDGEVFAATFGGGLMKLIGIKSDKAIFQSYSQKNGLVADIVYAIQPDNQNNLWLSTEKGLIKFNLQDKSFEHYDNDLSAFNIQFNEGAMAFDTKQIQIGTTKGIFYFNPQKVFKNTFTPPIYLSSLAIDNKVVTPKDSTHILQKALNESKTIRIPHNVHTLSIKYSALDMSNTEDIQYAYMLEGFDKEYRFAGKNREAIYTNLPHGHYTFWVKSTNNEGVWRHNEKAIAIHILPSFWETPYAWILYIIIGIGIITGIFRIYSIFYKLKDKAQKEELISQFKLKFFTNVSHELRTPLTLISGPLEYILTKESMPESLREKITIVKHNSDRMLRLINQILDFNKIQNNKMKLYVQQLDMIALLEQITQDFHLLAQKQEIKLEFHHPDHPVMIWCDYDKMEKISYNLLSNAFKYTPNGKSINIEIHEYEHHIAISVIDEGKGISPKKQKDLFKRFENTIYPDFINNPSTGIGLALTKELIELHKGSITVKSGPQKGSDFTITLLKGRKHFPKDTEFILSDISAHDKPASNGRPSCPSDTYTNNNETYANRMLIVEDNDELRSFIKEVFNASFQVYEASNGEEGIQHARTYIPDIIISDIMMPQKDGLQMLQELRQDITTSHIPIIILTAKADIDNKLKGLTVGADAYIVKPFSISYLQARVSNLLLQRERLQAYYNHTAITPFQPNTTDIRPSQTLTEKDRDFLSQLTEIIEKELSNPELSVDTLVEHFNFGRTIFFRKLKSLTGKSPIMYIKEARMQRAAQLIKENRYNISEIAYQVGFNDPHYFSKSFKQYYGVSPTEYIPS